MKKLFKYLGVAVLVVLVLIAGVITYVAVALPDVGAAPELTVERTTERIARGKYLANAVTVCMDCHSTRDWSKFSGPIVTGTTGKGGERFDQLQGFPGIYFSRNITPAGIGRYSDGELFRVITTGVTKEGHAMFPVMPYLYYGGLEDEDVYALIAYLRTLDPIENQTPESVSDFPVNIILNTIPKKGIQVKRPAMSDSIAYGAYMANASGCVECHTPENNGQIIRDLAFSGGRVFRGADGTILRSTNISPDSETGIGKWSKRAFIERFKAYVDSAYVVPTVAPGEFNTIMPWTMYGNMTEEDLGAIFTYLKTLPAHNNKVITFTPAERAAQ